MMLSNYLTAIILIVLGLFCVITKKDLIKIVLGLGITDYGINLFIVSLGFNEGGTSPQFAMNEIMHGAYFVDPVPQALTLTSIVIGACVDAMALAFVVMLYRHYGTTDSTKIRRLHG